jgi:hypothetical protein
VNIHPSLTGAAALAGLVVAGGAYAARHDVGLGDGLAASAGARARIEQALPVGVGPRRAALFEWHPPRVPHVRANPPAAVVPRVVTVTAVPAATAAAVPTTRSSPVAPVTRTSPAGGDDGGEGGGDD